MEVVSTTSTTDPINMYNYLNNFIMNPMVFVIIILIIIAYYVFSSYLGLGSNNSFSISSSESSSGYSSVSTIMSIIIIIILVILILVNAFQYFFSINLTAYIKGLFTPYTQVNLVVDNTTTTNHDSSSSSSSSNNIYSSTDHISITEKEEAEEKEKQNSIFSKLRINKQVFNVPGNYYSYDDAKAICKAYDSQLASYEQIENAYNKGAEWCNYGWSANQMALFPTQKNTYNTLQKIKGHENDCGRPGINGGYIANPSVRFGVNCYGYKPKITEQEEELMKNSSPYPETKEDKLFKKKVDYWKDKIDQILISPFNYNIWGAV